MQPATRLRPHLPPSDIVSASLDPNDPMYEPFLEAETTKAGRPIITVGKWALEGIPIYKATKLLAKE